MSYQRNDRGFTLLEVLVATALVGIAVAALMSGLSGSLRNLSRAEAYEKAILVGRAQLNRLLAEKLTPGELSGDWDEDYRWNAEISRWDPARRADSEETSTGVQAQSPVMVVRLTVSWKTARGEKQATLETCKYQVQ